MNKPLTDAELQTKIRKYNADVIDMVTGLFTRPPQQSYEADEDYTQRVEYRAMDLYFKAEAEFLSRVQDAWALTDICKEEMQQVIDAVHDYRVSRASWEEKVCKENRP